jgi:hypothetical protein
MAQAFFRLATGLGLLALAAQDVSAQTQRQCGPRDKVVERLASGYGESRQGIGLGSGNSVVEIFASETGSWTITVTNPHGVMCLIAAGQAFEMLAEALPTGDPT